jgi:small Trp-rich protein
MYFVVIGVVLVLLHLLGIGPPAAWTWNLLGDLWKFALPFLLAIVWWAWADASGLNKRREMERLDERKQKRRKENLVALGLGHQARRKSKP